MAFVFQSFSDSSRRGIAESAAPSGSSHLHSSLKFGSRNGRHFISARMPVVVALPCNRHDDGCYYGNDDAV